MRVRGHLYFHSPCFDGIVSAVLASDFLETRLGARHVSLRELSSSGRLALVASREAVYLSSVVLRGQAVCEANSVLDRIRGRFGIDVRDGACEEADLRRRRGDAFRFCRAILIQTDAASYAEQFEGMYALMRGLTTVFSFAATYHFGWGLGSRLPSTREFPVLIGLFVVIAVALGGLLGEKGWMYLAAVGLFFLGAWFGSLRSQSSQTVLPLLLGVGVVSGVIAYRCYGAYRRLASTFAASVYQAFFALGQDNFTGI